MKTNAIILPTEAEVPALTDRLVEINAEIAKLSEERKSIQARLDAYALTQHTEPLKDEAREGRRVMLRGYRHRLPVIFTSDLLIGSFKEGSPKHKELRALLAGHPARMPAGGDAEADEQLKLFFDPPTKWEARFEDGKKFRAAVAEWLPREVAAKFIAACTAVDKHGVKKSKTVFDFTHADQAGKEGA